jgi:addiction module HigA family antidote
MEEDSLLIHPSEVLLEEFLKPLNITTSKLAHSIQVKECEISNLISKLTPVSVEMDNSLATFFGISVGFFLSLQQKYESDRENEKLNKA